MTPIQSELLQFEDSMPVSPELLKLDKYRITTACELQEEDFLLKVKGCPCFPRKDLSAITGQAKTGKTNLISIIMACCTTVNKERRVLDFERFHKEQLRVMWVDTEQSPNSTLAILKKRLVRMVTDMSTDGTDDTQKESVPFPEELFYIFNIRKAGVNDRIELLTEGINAYRPDLVILDNVRDLVNDINDGQKAQELIERLMTLATEFECNIVCVIHQNRNQDNRGMRGWLGTELMNKVFEVFTCQKIRQKEGEKPTFCVEQSLTRKYDIDSPLYYQMSDEGIPTACATPVIQPRKPNGQFTTYGRADVDTLNQDYIIRHPEKPNQPWEWDLRKLFSTVMGSRATMAYSDLEKAVMQEAHIKVQRYYDKLFSLAEQACVVRKDKDRYGRIVVLQLPA